MDFEKKKCKSEHKRSSQKILKNTNQKRINNVGRNYRDHQQQWIHVEKKQKRNHYSCQMSQNFKRIPNCLQQMYQVSTNEHEYKNTNSM